MANKAHSKKSRTHKQKVAKRNANLLKSRLWTKYLHAKHIQGQQNGSIAYKASCAGKKVSALGPIRQLTPDGNYMLDHAGKAYQFNPFNRVLHRV